MPVSRSTADRPTHDAAELLGLVLAIYAFVVVPVISMLGINLLAITAGIAPYVLVPWLAVSIGIAGTTAPLWLADAVAHRLDRSEANRARMCASARRMAVALTWPEHVVRPIVNGYPRYREA